MNYVLIVLSVLAGLATAIPEPACAGFCVTTCTRNGDCITSCN